MPGKRANARLSDTTDYVSACVQMSQCVLTWLQLEWSAHRHLLEKFLGDSCFDIVMVQVMF